MGNEQNNEQHYREVVTKYIHPIASYQMTTRDYVVRPGAAAAITLTLPPVAEARGRFYSILNRGDGAVTITDHDDSECWADITLSGKCDAALLYSDGMFWHPSSFNGTPPASGAPTTAPGEEQIIG